jgi:hypothetical protein
MKRKDGEQGGKEERESESGVSGGGRLHSLSFLSFLTKLVYPMVNIKALIGSFLHQLVSAMFCQVNSTTTGM